MVRPVRPNGLRNARMPERHPGHRGPRPFVIAAWVRPVRCPASRRMEEIPSVEVDMFLDIPRPKGDISPSAILVSRFAQRFRDSQWPANHRLPRVFYDPRSVDSENPIRSSLHAKCIAVDGRRVFVSSANFTEAGQQRNIDVGLSIESAWLADRLTRHFRLLCSRDLAIRAF